MFSRIVADGVEIRLMEAADAAPLFAAVERDREILRQWLPWVDLTHSAADIAHFIARSLDRFASGDELHAGIWVDGRISGGIGHHAIDHANRSASLGYWLASDCQGRGVATRSCRALIDYLFDERGLHRLEIRCGTANQRSAAVAARLGFVREGVLREAQQVGGRWLDLMVWGLLSRNWR